MQKFTKDDLLGTAIERFWKYVTPTDGDACWEWQGARTPERKNQLVGYSYGYGSMRVLTIQGTFRQVYAHRIAYVLMNGNIPAGKCVMHTCDNPRCCNPKHLKLGTLSDNAIDREQKHRRPRKGKWAESKQIRDEAIIVDFLAGMKWREMTAKYDLNCATVYRIIRNAGVPTRRVKQIAE